MDNGEPAGSHGPLLVSVCLHLPQEKTFWLSKLNSAVGTKVLYRFLKNPLKIYAVQTELHAVLFAAFPIQKFPRYKC